jgi:hypothetical protein
MAVLTRIKNNQVTDASAGNIYLGVNAAAKVQDYSITAGKIQNNLTYGSDLTITGNLTVQGNTTTIDTVNLVVEDPLILLAKEQTGSPTLDIGFIGKRGTSDNIAWVWDESANSFVSVFTTSEVTNTTISINSYAAITAANLTATTGNFSGMVQVANLSVVGNISGAANFSGNVTASNFLTTGVVSATGNVTGGNLNTAGAVSATGNVDSGNLTTGIISATGNINGTGAVFSGNVTASYFIGNISGNIDAAGANTQVQFNNNDLLGASSNFTFDTATNILAVTGTIQGTTVSATGNVIGGNVTTAGLVSATGNVTGGNLNTAGVVSATGNVNSGNVNTGIMSASGNVTGGNVNTAGLVTATGNVTGGNIVTGGLITATGNINGANINTAQVASTGGITITSGGSSDISLAAGGNISAGTNYINNVVDPVQNQDAATKNYVDNLVTTAISYHEAVFVATTANLATTTGGTITYAQPNGAGNGVGATISTTGAFNLIDTGNVQTIGTRILVKDEGNAVLNGIYVWSNATVITRSSDADTYGPANANTLSINDYFFVQDGSVNKGSAYIVDAPSGTITFGTSNIQFAQFSQSQVYSANTQAGISLVGTVFSAKVDNDTTAFDGGGNISVKAGANLVTPNIGAATGTSLNVTGNVTGGNLTTAGLITATGNVTGGNINTAGAVSATGNVNSGNVNTAIVSATGNVTGGNLLTGGLISATGNVTSGNVNTGIVSASGNVAAAGFTGGNVSVTGNVIAQNFIGNISGNIDAAGSNTQVQFNDTGDILGASANFTFDKATNILAVTGTVQGTTVSATGNVIGGNVSTAGLITATGNITGANLILTSGTIDGPAAGRITINASDLDTDFAIDGDSTPNVFYVDAGLGTTSFGNSGAIANAIVSFNTSDSIKMPVGNTLQRPNPATVGMTRFSTAVDALEVYTSGGWETVGVPAFTVITDDQFTGTGACTTFTLSEDSTTAATIVSINGVVQIPTTAYSVTGNSLVFTEAPEVSDTIDARLLTTTTTVTSIENVSANAVVAVTDTANTVLITGDILPTGNGVANIGSTSFQFNTVFAKATSAQYADLAEMYVADRMIEPGTVVCFGGDHEVTICDTDSCSRVAGVVSTNPSYIMNAGLAGDNVVAVALTGRVPTRVTGVIRKGDMMVSTADGRARAESAPAVGQVIGKALADFDGIDGVIEVVVGRL